MGCAPSKAVDDLPLVKLCRERKQLLKSAADQRLSLAGAHIAYFTHLRLVADSLCRFVDEELTLLSSSSSSSPSPPSSLSSSSSDGKKKQKQKNKTSSFSTEEEQQGGNNSSHLNLSSFSSSSEHRHAHSSGHLEIETESGDEMRGEEEPKVAEKMKTKVKTKMKKKDPSASSSNYQPGISYNPNHAQNGGNYASYPNFNPAFYDNSNDRSSNYYHPAQPVYPPYYDPSPSSSYYPGNYENSNGYGGTYDDSNNAYGGLSSSYTTFYMKKSSAQVPSVIYEEPRQNTIYEYSHYPPSGDYPDYGSNVGGFGFVMNEGERGSVSFNREKKNEEQWRPGYAEYLPNAGGGGGGGFGFVMNEGERGSSSSNRQQQEHRPAPAPTPPSPKVSAWDYFNPFETFEGGAAYYGQEDVHGNESNSSSPDSREVREREGIPDLEEETESEVMKEQQPYYNEKRKVAQEEEFGFPKSKNNKHVQFEGFGGRNGGNNNGKKKKKKGGNFSEETLRTVPMHDQRNEEEQEAEVFRAPEPEPVEVREAQTQSSILETDSSISTGVDVEEVSMKKKGVSFDVGGTSHLDMESSKPSSLTTLSTHGTRDLREVVREIKDEFEAATDYGKEVSVLLEVDKEPYRSRSTFLKVMLARVCSGSLSSYHSPSSLAVEYPETAEDNLDSRSLASTLDKLYVWEQKLYKEVKDEERLRVMYEKQCERLKDLDDRGAESNKIEASQATIRKLLTKINVSVRAIDSISSRIHKLRDDELQPQLKELVYGLRRMWKLLFKCHQKQFQAILESKIRALKANTGLRRDSSVRATIELEAELLKWCHRFHHWIETQRSYAETLNNWLVKSLLYEPEDTSDGQVPYSPGKIGAPQVFITCHDWKDAMERISDSTVQTTLHDFATSLHQLWERQDEEQRRRLTAEITYKDFEKQFGATKMERQRRAHDHNDETSSDKNSLSMVASESGISALDDLKVDLDTMKQRVREERAGHKEAIKLVHDAVSRSIQGGLVPIFEALESFTSEASKAFDEVRLEHVSVDD